MPVSSSSRGPAGTFPELLERRLRVDPGQPLVTFYDDATGERTELSVTTYANWVAKTAGVLLEELLLDPGDLVQVDLPPHWLGPVFAGAVWAAGLRLTTDPTDDADARVCGPDTVPEDPAGTPTVACALLPFAAPFRTSLPPGVVDFGHAWTGQPDSFVAPAPVTGATLAWADGTSQADLLLAASGHPAGRLLTDADPLAEHAGPAFLGPLAAGGSLVLLVNASADRWEAVRAAERATDVRGGIVRDQRTT